jgi:hypothetical protein
VCCGSKYDPDDTTNCIFCTGFRYDRTEKEVCGALRYSDKERQKLFEKWRCEYSKKKE